MIEYWYKLKHKVFPRCLAFLIKQLIFLLLKTCKIKIIGKENLQKIKCDKCILMFWHNRLLLAPAILYKHIKGVNFGVLVSQSRDGEIIASIVNSYKVAKSIRVAHDSKKEALGIATNYLNEQKGILVITPDGPRGPKYKIKKGVAFLAKMTNAKVIPMSWSVNKSWRLKSWDHLIIPKPFSNIVCSIGKPIQIPLGERLIPCTEEIEKIENHLNQLKDENLLDLQLITNSR